jgi:hypothetical protein
VKKNQSDIASRMLIVIDSLQATMNAIIHAVDDAHECYDNNPDEWGKVIEAASELLTREDVRRFANLCNAGHRDVGSCEYDHVEEYNSSFATRPTYYVIRRGVLEDDEDMWEDEENPHVPFEGEERYMSGRQYFLAYRQWYGYMEWLRQRPRDMRRYREFEVCLSVMSFCVIKLPFVLLTIRTCSCITRIARTLITVRRHFSLKSPAMSRGQYQRKAFSLLSCIPRVMRGGETVVVTVANVVTLDKCRYVCSFIRIGIMVIK